MKPRRCPESLVSRNPLALILAALLTLSCSQSLAAAEPAPSADAAISLEITGDEESPMVLYIQPWRSPEAPLPVPPQLNDPSLSPLEPCQVADALTAEEIQAWSCREAKAAPEAIPGD